MYSPAATASSSNDTSMSISDNPSSIITYDQTVSLTFHHVDYLLHVCVRYAPAAPSDPADPSSASSRDASPPRPTPVLVIEAEQRSNGHRWTGEFTAKYIEEMSLKTGNFKKFPLFIKMLSSALSKASDSVFIDLLTFQDLEGLKARQQPNAGAATPAPQKTHASAAALQNKRYVILTYVPEFDKIHYPLPLKFESDLTPAHMSKTIARLRTEVDSLRGNATANAGVIEKYKLELYRLAEENHRLKTANGNAAVAAAAAALTASTNGAASKAGDKSGFASGAVYAAAAAAVAPIEPLEAELLRTELRTMRTQLDIQHQLYSDLLKQSRGSSDAPADALAMQSNIESLSSHVWTLQSDLRLEQQQHGAIRVKAEKESTIMMDELERRMEKERLLRNKVRALQDEIKQMRSDATNSSTMVESNADRTGISRMRGSGSARQLSSSRARSPYASPSYPRSPASSRGGQHTANRSRPRSATSSRESSPSASLHARRPSANSSPRYRSQSPGGGGSVSARFDPSAYIKQRAEQHAASLKRNSSQSHNLRVNGGKASTPATPRTPLPEYSAHEHPTPPRHGVSRSASNGSLKQIPIHTMRNQITATNSSSSYDSNPAPRHPQSSSNSINTSSSNRPQSAAVRSTSRSGDLSTARDRPDHRDRPDQSSRAILSSRPSTARERSARRRDEQQDESDRESDYETANYEAYNGNAMKENNNGKSADRDAHRETNRDSIDKRFSALQEFLTKQRSE